MFFIYLFFGIGVLATLILMLSSLLEVYTFIASLFKTLRQAKKNKAEVRTALLERKKELKLAKINNKKDNAKEPEVEEVAKVEAEVETVEAEETKEEKEPVAEGIEPKAETEVLNNPYINTEHYEN